jgi:hypothetical protein
MLHDLFWFAFVWGASGENDCEEEESDAYRDEHGYVRRYR